MEALALSVISGMLGWAVGTLGSSVIAEKIARLDVGVAPDPRLAAWALGLAVLVGIVGSLYPALRASALDPAESLRSI